MMGPDTMSEAEARYTANMEYSAAAIRRLTELQHSCFRLGEKIVVGPGEAAILEFK